MTVNVTGVAPLQPPLSFLAGVGRVRLVVASEASRGRLRTRHPADAAT